MLLTKLKAIQADRGWTDLAMAAALKVGRSTWTEIKNGRIPLSERVQFRAVRAFPELADDLLSTVSSEASEVAQ